MVRKKYLLGEINKLKKELEFSNNEISKLKKELCEMSESQKDSKEKIEWLWKQDDYKNKETQSIFNEWINGAEPKGSEQ